jgi:hypothetical protein
MLRHRALHERPEVRPRMLVKRPASPEPGPSTNQGNIKPQILFNNEDVEIIFRKCCRNMFETIGRGFSCV